jgi:CDP-glycerol glycerophosphotransferase (TagB/SpsB family)
VNTVWVPTETIKRNLNDLGLRSVKVVGQPSLETWYRLVATVNPASLYARLHIPPGKKILLFAGQYGEGYADILEAFLRAALVELNSQEDMYLVLSYHPKTTGELEREAIERHPHPRLILMPQGMTTAELATVSSAVVTWRSTVGIQAAFLGKPVLYFNFDLHDYTNNLIEKGLAFASTPTTFGPALHQALTRQNDSLANRKRLAKLGYVIDADRKIASEIVRLIRRG